jgi:glycosyltransferase involved in cell wall biosynthesis
MCPPRVSVIMTAYNAAATAARAIESIQRQMLADWELVVVDDGSSDDTPALLERLARRDARVRFFPRAHEGLVAALNAALALSRSSLVARMDADDESHPERLAEQVDFLHRHPDAGLVGSLVTFGGNVAAAGGFALHVDWLNGVVTPEEIALNRFIESPFAHPSVMFRRELATRHGGYREGDFPEDYELWLRWLEAGVVMGKVPRALLTWHDSPARLSRTHRRYDVEAFYRCKAAYLARWLQRHVNPARQILVWGAGRPTRKRAEHLMTHGVRIAGYIDIDPRKQGRRLAGRAVIAPTELPAPAEAFVLGYVAKRGARDLARAFLEKNGCIEGQDFLMAA